MEKRLVSIFLIIFFQNLLSPIIRAKGWNNRYIIKVEIDKEGNIVLR